MDRRGLIYLHTGTNLGEKLHNLLRANQLIEKEIGKILDTSEVFYTEAWGVTDQPGFLNQALLVKTILKPEQVMEAILRIEKKMGRVREKKWQSRIIDIDILFYDDEMIEKEHLIIPHPHLHKRNFVLAPMADLAPDHVHPVLNYTIRELFEKTQDTLEVKEWN